MEAERRIQERAEQLSQERRELDSDTSLDDLLSRLQQSRQEKRALALEPSTPKPRRAWLRVVVLVLGAVNAVLKHPFVAGVGATVVGGLIVAAILGQFPP